MISSQDKILQKTERITTLYALSFYSYKSSCSFTSLLSAMYPGKQLQPVFQNIIQLIHIQRFRDMSIHACIFGQLYIFCKSIGSHGNNRQFSLFTRKAPDCCSCLITIHDRHLDIHKNKIIQSFRRSFHFFNCDFSIFCRFHFCTCHLQNFTSNFSVQLIILNQQNPFSRVV